MAPVEVDLGTPGEFVERAVEEFGGVDALVNNVGTFAPRLEGFAAITDEDWQRTFDVNFMSAVRASRAALPHMVERGGGAIVNVSSINARLPQSPVTDYAAAKAALTNLSKLLAEETEGSDNTFPALPVREGEQVFVWFSLFRDRRAYDRHAAALGRARGWREGVANAPTLKAERPPEALRLSPTARSLLPG